MKKKYLKNLFFMMSFLVILPMMAQTKLQKEHITSRYDSQKIQQLKNQFSQRALSQKQQAIQIANQKGWQIRFTTEDGRLQELQKVVNGKPIYYTTFNVDAAKSTRTDHLNSGGSLGLNLDGQNMTAHVWDGGLARASHQEYDGLGGNNRFSIGDGTTTLSFHSAHVTGTIIASGVVANAKGMAPQASAVGYDWNSDTAEGSTAAGNGMLISNHSYGYIASGIPDQWFGAYGTDARDWDQIMFNAPNYLMVVAAGNDGNDNSSNAAPLSGNSSYDKLSGHATAKNNMVVANAQDANINANGDLVSVSINSSSSEGPTDDFRIKPDITGNGTAVYSTYESSNTAYNSITGTSMASPNVAGTLLILQQHANNVNGSFMRAATLKGLALHTADDAGANGPDAIFGWGLLNGKSAAQAITQNGNESKIEELTLTSGQSYQITVDSDGVNDLMASISWTDRAGTVNSGTNSSTAALVNDLDIRVTKGGTTSNPWRLTGVNSNGLGDNTVDPYERVDVANATGTYTITVTHKGSLTGGSQNYSLIVTGLTGTPVVCNATVPSNLSIDGFGSSTATVSWDVVAGATYDLRYRQTGTTTWTTNAVSGTTSSLSGLASLTQYEVQVRSKCPDNSTSAYSNSVNFTTTEVQLNYCTSASTNTNDEFISRVQLGSIDNTSGAQFYSDFTNQSTNLTQGQSYTITVTPTWTGTIYNEAYSVWIDYNHDGDFADTGEQVWTQGNTQATSVSGNFTIPSGAFVGATRMRVSMKYNAIPTSCETFTYGEVEDYTVNLDGGTPDTTAPVITLTGAATINLNVGDTYTEQGATATDNVDGNLTSSIVIGGDTVNTNVAGTYVVTYNVSDAAGNAATQVIRTVIVTAVADTIAPVITLTGASTINLSVGDTYTEQGATATDNVDGNLTSSIVIGGDTVNTNVVGTYVVTYDVSDAAGNAATQVTRTVNVSDNTAPVITLIGASTINLNVGDTYTEQGATATDNVDGNLTSSIVIGGDTVNTNVAGTYVVTYNVSDAAGNAATQIIRTVIVSPISGGGCSGGISSFPYNEGFENTLGAWTQSTADDINWTVDANGTPSSGTGPSSASQGTYYVYVEASGNGTGYPNKQAILNSPCFDLSAETSATFSFKYHQYGSTNMGTIDLEASDDNGSTWTSVWNSSGNLGNSWQTANIDLAAYLGGSVQLRFNRVTGSTWQADIAIDDVSLTNGSTGGGNTTVVLTINFDNYPEETSWEILDSGNSIVASGGTYGSQADGSTLNINVDLPTGCYSLVMKDSYGDGICCSYGNGSYTLTDAGTTLASGGSFTSTDTTSFCVGGATASTGYAITNISEDNTLFKVSPNPVKDKLNISLIGLEAQSFRIMNMLGQEVLKGLFAETLNVSKLEEGIYLLEVQIGSKTKIERFVKR